MALHIQHTYSTHVEITYLDSIGNYSLKEQTCGSMDEIAEHICEVLVKHNFTCADACSCETGEILLIIDHTQRMNNPLFLL